MSDRLRAARPGELTCVEEECAYLGAPLIEARCPYCGSPTYAVPPHTRRTQPQRKPAVDRSSRPLTAAAQSSRQISTGDLLGRVVFGGFWTMATLGLVVLGILGLASGHLAGLLALGLAALTGLYARYIIRGGRVRILFW